MVRIVYLATADARGHLMRAQLLTHALRRAGAEVDVWTTSEAGVQFLAAFGIEAALLSRHYAVQFDARQNMRRGATDRTVAHYMLRPGRMARDLVTLWRLGRGGALIVNDSFHPALLCLGALPGWRRRVVHVYGGSLRRAVEGNFDGRLPPPLARTYRKLVAALIDRTAERLEHDFGAPAKRRPGVRLLPTPVAVARRSVRPGPRPVAVYLNPHFRDPALAGALLDGLHDAGCPAHCVGEGYAAVPGWQATDDHWVDTAAHAPLIVAAPGMAALSVAAVYRRPILLLQTDQPEQRDNAARAASMGIEHGIVTFGGDPAAFRRNVAAAARTLLEVRTDDGETGIDAAEARLGQWVAVLRELASTAAVGDRRHREGHWRRAAVSHA